MPITEPLHTVRQTANGRGCSTGIVYRDIRTGKLRAVVIADRYLVPETAFADYVRRPVPRPTLCAEVAA